MLKDLKHNIGEALNTAAEAIEEHNSSLEGVLVTIDFNIKNKLSDKKLQDLLSHFNKHRLRNADFERPDLLGTAYEYLIKMFADSAGKKGGEFYTPSEVVQLLVSLLKPHAGMRIYDPTSGSGGMLVQMRNYLAKHGENAANLSLYGQEMNLNTWAICKMNMFLHGVHSADIRKGDTLREPKHTQGGELMHFDRVIANPPFSLKKWGKEECDSDGFGRFPYGTPPKDAGDLAFVQHMIASTNNDGMVGVVMPHGVLFRGSSEKAIRQGILEDDLLEAVVGLPAGLFYGTGIPACLLIINKQKPAARKGKVLFINSELEFEPGKNQNKLRPQDIAKIVETFENHTFESKSDIKRYSRVVELSEIADNDYNLNIRRYADTSPPAEIFDVRAILHGGIPVREVEDVYIQEEILNGFDVTCVLTPRHSGDPSGDSSNLSGHSSNLSGHSRKLSGHSRKLSGHSREGGKPAPFEYYDFKAEIQTKEQIRPLVESSLEQENSLEQVNSESSGLTAMDGGNADNAGAIVGQLERWWDKYHISLHQLDAEVLEAEQVMQGYLKELGYE